MGKIDIEEDKLVRIEWVDSASTTDWIPLKHYEEQDTDPIKIITYGLIVEETDTYVVIAQNYGLNPPQICNTMTIPKGCIVNRKIISITIKDGKDGDNSI